MEKDESQGVRIIGEADGVVAFSKHLQVKGRFVVEENGGARQVAGHVPNRKPNTLFSWIIREIVRLINGEGVRIDVRSSVVEFLRGGN